MAFWNRFPYSNFHEINLDWIIREMKKISGSVSDFARQWEKALKQETGERQEADRQLQENIDAEQDRAEAAEEALDQKIEAETSRAEAAEEALDQKIEAETNRAEAAEKVLDDKITAETERATAAESNLQQQITSNDTDIAALQKGLQDETTARTEADETLDQKITAETSRATAREDELEGMIQTETERATAKENELDQKITTETERATAAEGALGDRIDGLEGELEGVTGADSPFIRKDGTTTTTGKIPLAQGGTSEVDPAAATDLVNLRSMQAADQALENSMTEYVDNQLEAAVGDVHSIPAGGTTGQVLGKSSDTDYAVQWVDQSGGGTPGPQGPEGPQGPAGPGVAAGGTAGQVLSKVDATDYNTKWIDPPGGGWEYIGTVNGFSLYRSGVIRMLKNPDFVVLPMATSTTSIGDLFAGTSEQTIDLTTLLDDSDINRSRTPWCRMGYMTNPSEVISWFNVDFALLNTKKLNIKTLTIATTNAIAIGPSLSPGQLTLIWDPTFRG